MKRAIIYLAAIVLARVSAFGCSCGPTPPVPKALNAASAVFAGRCVAAKLIDKKFEDGSIYNMREFTFEVDHVWKGASDSKQLVVETGLGMGDCGYGFEVGFSYVVYAYDAAGRLVTNHCTRTFSTGMFAPSTGDILVDARPEIDALDEAAHQPKRKWPEPTKIPGLEPIPKSK